MKTNGTDAKALANADLRSQTPPRPRVLVVEDEDLLRQLNASALSRAGYEVDTAADGAAAWQALNLESYDLLITDNNMPNLSGVGLLKKLHAARMFLPVIMATGTMPTDQFARYPWLQPLATLFKPYTSAEMVDTVKNVLREVESTADGPPPLTIRGLKEDQVSPTVEPATRATERAGGPGLRILAVDEDSDLRRLYAEALARPGYRIDAVGDGAAGWEALQARPYELLITEHDLPNLSGIELVSRLRSAHMALPVVMAATRFPAEELARNPSLQFAAALAKPFSVDLLLDTVGKALREAEGAYEQTDTLRAWHGQPRADALRR